MVQIDYTAKMKIGENEHVLVCTGDQWTLDGFDVKLDGVMDSAGNDVESLLLTFEAFRRGYRIKFESTREQYKWEYGKMDGLPIRETMDISYRNDRLESRINLDLSYMREDGSYVNQFTARAVYTGGCPRHQDIQESITMCTEAAENLSHSCYTASRGIVWDEQNIIVDTDKVEINYIGFVRIPEIKNFMYLKVGSMNRDAFVETDINNGFRIVAPYLTRNENNQLKDFIMTNFSKALVDDTENIRVVRQSSFCQMYDGARRFMVCVTREASGNNVDVYSMTKGITLETTKIYHDISAQGAEQVMCMPFEFIPRSARCMSNIAIPCTMNIASYDRGSLTPLCIHHLYKEDANESLYPQ